MCPVIPQAFQLPMATGDDVTTASSAAQMPLDPHSQEELTFTPTSSPAITG
jgi:hypothetical protein